VSVDRTAPCEDSVVPVPLKFLVAVQKAVSWTPDATWDGHQVWFDLTAAEGLITLPAAASLPPGWSCGLRVHGPAVTPLQVRTTADDDSLNDFWRTKHPDGSPMRYGRFVQQTGQLTCDGTSRYALDVAGGGDPMPQQVRILTKDSNLGPASGNSVIWCDAADNPIHVVIESTKEWCPTFLDSGRCPLIWTVEIGKIDPSAHRVVIWTENNMSIEPSNDSLINPGHDRGYLYLTQLHDTVQLFISADRVRVQNFFRSRHLPLK
jgi:hypothetical protein